MKVVDFVAQPVRRTTLDAVEAIVAAGELRSMDIAAAYVTSSGVQDLLQRMDGILADRWKGVKKRWITSFDYCRTQPVALSTLLSLPTSSVHIYDAQYCLAHAGTPKTPFHPKAFLFRGKDYDFVLAGSGNLSRSGLSRGVEVGLTLTVRRSRPIEPTSAAAVKSLRRWYSTVWRDTPSLDPVLLERYTELFDSAANLAHPTATEDDLAGEDVTRGALDGSELRKLRVCSHLWIEAGRITKNRGRNLPGNQLMMKRLSRVFFGYSPEAVPTNTTLGSVNIRFGEGEVCPYTLSYSDNKMDKLNLPMPGTIGPAAYDEQDLLFSQVSTGVFSLAIGKKGDKSKWLRQSKAIDADYKMASGRKWGVF